ncbi:MULTISPECIES: lysophospholipid acyltransferase family protein [unclassified Brevundimonas]|uniref:lysophospholipid acyltransferase family protein n=1 Tax=unclassified Brevundimonas TaxID=2622653 RepID=UPI0025C2A9B8|nr:MULTISPECIES: lysophospholipid acyltransferase family protein [unclassified Brevundimonas]
MRPLRNPVIQRSIAFLFSEWLRFCFATTRWTHENEQVAEAVWAQKNKGVLIAFWHSRLGIAAASWPMDRAQPPRAMISLSADGEFIAKAVARLGIPAVRGSSSNKDKREASKGGTQALRDGLKYLKSGGGLAITPDGPRGPARQMAEGLPVMARMSGVPVLILGASVKPAIRLKSWDRALIPLPFAKGAIVWDRADFPENGDVTEVAEAWTERLTAAEARADEITGLERV